MNEHNVRIREIKNLQEAESVLREIGADEMGQRIMSPKALFRVLQVDNLSPWAANILKQQMLSLGGEAGVHRGVIKCSVAKSSALLLGTRAQFSELKHKLYRQPFGMKVIADEIDKTLEASEGGVRKELDCRGRKLPLGKRTLIMGILNITPDSFSDGGKYFSTEDALRHARYLVKSGSDILDIGAESTRPGYTPISEKEELNRLLPVLKEITSQVTVPISVDTHKSKVARAALENGAHLINDVWALTADKDMARVIADYNVPVVLMHNQHHTNYVDVMGDIIRFLRKSIIIAENQGIDPDNIIVDPGIGFGKTLYNNLEVMRRLSELRSLGKTILLGTSRKSFIGKTLGLPVNERVEGTAATVVLGIVQGADIIRVHDVKEMARAARMADAIVRPGGEPQE